MQNSDAELVQKCLEGDKVAFESIVERYRKKIHGLCSAILRSPDRGMDAAQETFVRAFESLATLQQREKLEGWLKVIAVNCCRSLLRLDKPHEPIETEGEVRFQSSAPSAEQQLIASERAALLSDLIDRLKPRQKLVFVMKHVDEYTYNEISQLTGFSDTEVKSYLQNARRNLENWWHEAPRRARGA